MEKGNDDRGDAPLKGMDRTRLYRALQEQRTFARLAQTLEEELAELFRLFSQLQSHLPDVAEVGDVSPAMQTGRSELVYLATRFDQHVRVADRLEARQRALLPTLMALPAGGASAPSVEAGEPEAAAAP